MMKKMGMKRERVLRQDSVTHGQIIDVVFCGIARAEWERLA